MCPCFTLDNVSEEKKFEIHGMYFVRGKKTFVYDF